MSEKNERVFETDEPDLGLEGKLVLVVDDDPDLRLFVREALEGANLRVHLAADGVEALDQLAKEAPDVVLLDIRMPGLSGDEILTLLNKLHGHPPVIIMTAADRARDMALERRNPLYLAKPFDAPLLLATIETALEGIEDASEIELDS